MLSRLVRKSMQKQSREISKPESIASSRSITNPHLPHVTATFKSDIHVAHCRHRPVTNVLCYTSQSLWNYSSEETCK